MTGSSIGAKRPTGRRRRIFAVAGVCMLALGCLRAAPIEADLGDGLRYYRAHAIPAELPPAALQPGPLVLDLRFAACTDAAGAALQGWVRFRATAATPLLLLVNGHTAPEIANALAADHELAGLMIVGLPAPGLQPDIVVRTTPDADRRAYEALEHGTPIPALVTENADKPRSDEAALIRERAPTVESDTDEEPPDADESDRAPEAVKPEPTIDFTLQRAIQIHHALHALKRI